jgi:hypothetical protein
MVRVDTAVDVLRRLGHRSADAAGLSVAVDGERSTVATQPGLSQDVGEQGERARLTLDLTDKQVHQARLHQQAGLAGGALHNGAQLVG